MKVGYILTDNRETSGTPRFRFYNNLKHFKSIQAEIYNKNNKYDALVFVKRFSIEDIKLAENFEGVKIFDINDNFFEASAFACEEQVNNCCKMAAVCDAVSSPSHYILEQAKKHNSNTFFIADHIDEYQEDFVVSWHGLASNIKHVLEYYDFFSKNNIKLVCCADFKTNLEATKRIKENYKSVELIEWSKENVFKVIKNSDVLVSPKKIIESQWENGKSFNKLLFGVRTNKLCLGAKIPEYVELKKHFPELIELYSTEEEFKQKLIKLKKEKEQRQSLFAKDIALSWENLIKSQKVPSVSIITSAYNSEKTLSETIESVLSQSFQDFEYIIVNDASTDNTLNIIEKYSEKDFRIKLINNDVNLKQAKSRNKAIKQARAKYIINIDADDIMSADRIKNSLEFIKKNNADIVYGGYTSFDDVTKEQHNYSPPREYSENVFLNEMNLINNSSVIMKRGIFYDEVFSFAEDYSAWLNKIKVGGKIMSLNKNFTLFRLSQNSNSFKNNNLEKQETEKDNIISFWKSFETNKPKISIIMPTYNREKIIYRSIESVLSQTFKNFELIIVNDGGRPLKKVIDFYNDKRIKYYEKQNGGLSSALNYGVEKASTNYIFLLDDDDLWTTDHAEILYKALIAGHDVVYSDCERIDNNNNHIAYYSNNFNQEILMWERNLLTTCSSAFNKNIFYKVGGFDERLKTHMDWDFWKKAVKQGASFKHIKCLTSFYVVHNNNMLAGVFSEKNEKDRLEVKKR